MSVDKRKQLEDVMRKYVDESNCIDISRFRKENPSEYALLPHYFGGVNQAVEYFGWIKVSKNDGKITLRNQLAYAALKAMRKNNLTLEQIAEMFNVTRPAINQLYQALKSQIENDSEGDDIVEDAVDAQTNKPTKKA